MAEGADRIHEIFVWGFGRFRVCCICWGHSAKPAFLTRFTMRLGTDDSGPFVFLGGGPLSGAVRSCFRGALERQRGFRGLKFGASVTNRAWRLARGMRFVFFVARIPPPHQRSILTLHVEVDLTVVDRLKFLLATAGAN